MISLSDNNLTVIDTVSGFESQAVLRWHLLANKWQLQDQKLTSDNISIEISADVKVEKIALVDSYQSRYYLQKEATLVLEITLVSAGKIKTLVNWTS